MQQLTPWIKTRWLSALLLAALFCFFIPNAQARRITGAQGLDPAPTAVKADKSAPAPQAKEAGGEEELLYNIDFTDTDIAEMVEFISKLTGKNFILDRNIKGKVTIISPKKITAEEAYKVFESVLEINNFTTVEAGEIIKIVPAPTARSKDVETRLDSKVLGPPNKDREDKIITQIIPLKYANPNDIKKIFQPLISKSSVMVGYDDTNTLIITDFQSNVERLIKILGVIDVKGVGQEITVIPLENAVATEMTKLLSTLFTQQKARAAKAPVVQSVRMVADERTNSIIVLASQVDTGSVRDLIRSLDREVPRGRGKIRVYYLQNATAEDVAKVLEKLSSGKAAPKGKKGEAPLISNDVVISADKATNSLIITAEQDDYLIMEEVIQKLDIPRSMVYIEALIMEVSTQKNFELGVEWRGGEEFELNGGKGVYFGGSGGGGTGGAYKIFPSPTLAGSTLAVPFPTGFSLGVVGEAIKIGDMVFPTIGAIIRAYKNDSDIHILSAPQLLTTNNEEAKMIVGKNVPYATKAETSVSNVDYTTYEYKDVGVTLQITPTISQERFVKLKIFQEVTRLVGEAETDRPTTFKRSADTTVVVKDGYTVVLGGLIDQSTEGRSYQVPCLGDIPYLGWFFRSTGEQREKTNLYIFLTPHILEGQKEATRVFNKKAMEIRKIEEEAVKLYERRGDLNLAFDEMMTIKQPPGETDQVDVNPPDLTPEPSGEEGELPPGAQLRDAIEGDWAPRPEDDPNSTE